LFVQAVQPQKTLFICSPETEKRVDEICEACGLTASQFDKAVVPSTDAVAVYKAVLAFAEKVKMIEAPGTAEGLRTIMADITGGTKVMVSACGMAAALLGIDIWY